MNEVYKAIVDLLNEGKKGAVATVIAVKGSSPQIVGAKMLVREDGSIEGTVGGGMMEAIAVEKCLEVIKSQVPESVKIDLTGKTDDGPICGGEAEVFIEPVTVMPRIVVFGAGHVGTCVAKVAKVCGFRVLMVDDREEWANTDRLQNMVDEIVLKPFEEVFDHVRFLSTDSVVIVTRGHKYDEWCLENVVKRSLAYIGMIGSKVKVARIYKNLETRGIDGKLLEKVHAPIGLEIGAVSPAEIAVSIIAEIIKVYHGV